MVILSHANVAACQLCRMLFLPHANLNPTTVYTFLQRTILAACHSCRMSFFSHAILAVCHSCRMLLSRTPAPPNIVCDKTGDRFISGAGSFSKKGFISSSVLGSLKKNDVVKYKQLCSNNCFKQKWSSTTTCKSRQCEFFQYEHLTRTCKVYDASAASEFTLVKNPRRTSFSRPNQCPVHCVVPTS